MQQGSPLFPLLVWSIKIEYCHGGSGDVVKASAGQDTDQYRNPEEYIEGLQLHLSGL